MNALAGVTDPESEKRKAIGNAFIRGFRRRINKLEGSKNGWDKERLPRCDQLISVKSPSATIKSHP